MKSITSSSLLLLLLSTPVAGGSKTNEKATLSDLEGQFVTWMKFHDKAYENTIDMLHRMDVWLENHGTLSRSLLYY